MNARAPKCPDPGSHRLDVKKEMPAFWNAGHASLVVDHAINARITKTSKPPPRATYRNTRSLRRPADRGLSLSFFGVGGVLVSMLMLWLWSHGLRWEGTDAGGTPAPSPPSSRNDDLVELGLGRGEDRRRQAG